MIIVCLDKKFKKCSTTLERKFKNMMKNFRNIEWHSKSMRKKQNTTDNNWRKSVKSRWKDKIKSRNYKHLKIMPPEAIIPTTNLSRVKISKWKKDMSTVWSKMSEKGEKRKLI